MAELEPIPETMLEKGGGAVLETGEVR